MMDYEDRMENRIENIFHPESNKSSMQFHPTEVHNPIGVPQNYVNNLCFEYDVLLYALMEGNHMPFNRTIPTALDETIDGSGSLDTSQSCALQYRTWPLAYESQQSSQSISAPDREILMTSNQFNQTNYQSSKQLTKQPLDAFYNDAHSIGAEQDSDPRQLKFDFSRNSPREPYRAESPFQSLNSAPASEFFPRSAPEIELPAQEELTALQKHYYTYLLGSQNEFNGSDGVTTGTSQDTHLAEIPLKTEFKQEEPSHTSELQEQEPDSQAMLEKNQAKKKAKKTATNIKAVPRSGILSEFIDLDSGDQYPALPVECLSPLERWKQHCQKFKKPKIKKGPVYCPHCNDTFENMEECAEHLDQEGFKHKNICPDESCKYSIFGFRVRSHLRRHICNEHLKRYNQKRLRSTQGRKRDLPSVKLFLSHVYVCKHKDCSRAFYRSDSLTRHGRLTHEGKGPTKASEASECDIGM